MVVHHVSGSVINTFTPQMRSNGAHPYFYFTENQAYADRFARLWNIKKPVVHDVYLNIKNPLMLEGGKKNVSEWASILSKQGVRVHAGMIEAVSEAYGDEVFGWQLFRDDTGEFSNAVKRAGFDGIKTTERSGDTTWVAFDSVQIKSATDNVGTFDETNPDIRYSERDYDTITSELETAQRELRDIHDIPEYKEARMAAINAASKEERNKAMPKVRELAEKYGVRRIKARIVQYSFVAKAAMHYRLYFVRKRCGWFDGTNS